MTILDQFTTIANSAAGPLDRLHQLYGVEEPDPPRWRIWTNTGLRHCSICGRDDRWVDDGRAYVCEHQPPVWGCWGIRQLDSAGKGKVVEAVEAYDRPDPTG